MSFYQSYIDKTKDLFADFGLTDKPSIGSIPQNDTTQIKIVDSNESDFFVSFDRFTDSRLYSPFKIAGPNCLAYAYGLPKELNGSRYKYKPSPGHFAGLDTSDELSKVMETKSPAVIKATFEKYMAMDFAVLGKEMVEVQSASYQPQRGERVFALVTAPHIPGFGSDFHFYVKDKNGYWSHKPGTTNPTVFDNSGNTIKDPSKRDRGIYTNFVGFYVIKDKQER